MLHVFCVQVVSALPIHVRFVRCVMMLVSYNELQRPLHGCVWISSCCHLSLIGVEQTETDRNITLSPLTV